MSNDLGWAALSACCFITGSALSSGDELTAGIGIAGAVISYIGLFLLDSANTQQRAVDVSRVISSLDGPNYGEKTFVGVPGSFKRADGTARAIEVDKLADGRRVYRIGKKLEDITPDELAKIIRSNTLAFKSTTVEDMGHVQ